MNVPGDKLPTRIVRYPDPCLRRKCAPIDRFNGSLAALAQRMLELMHAGDGVGLAGPQVGLARRIFVCNPTGEPADDQVFVNPELSDLTGAIEAEEGCLSIPDVRITVRRALRCKIRAFDVTGQPIAFEGEGLIARIWQQEADHLEGRLTIDRMNDTERIVYKKKLAALTKRYQKAAR